MLELSKKSVNIPMPDLLWFYKEIFLKPTQIYLMPFFL